MTQSPADLGQSPIAASAVSGHLDTRTAATEAANLLFDDVGTTADLALVFGSFHHRSAFDAAADIVRQTLMPKMILGATAESVIGADVELEGVAGLSVMALRMPGARLHPWTWMPDDSTPLDDAAAMRERLGVGRDMRVAMMIGDPFTTPTPKLLPAISDCDGGRPVPLIGGMASGASQPGLNVLVLNDHVASSGAVGITLSGPFDVDFVVSQGCRPIGTPLVVTKCKDNLLLELGGRKAIEALQETAQGLSEAEKNLLKRGLLIGTVINEYKERFGRGDFLVRNIMGLDQRVGGIVTADLCRVGQTVQFHVRDGATATEDLQLLLDLQVMNPVQPFGALAFSCNGRGEKLFGEPNHDVGVIRSRLGEIPMAGFFAAGEIGPVGGRNYLHGHTASVAILRGQG